ncbi:GNAT family N-acetyltransferase [Streptomyces justiciae]|uniref:GNAT family N-acetyltransferase n=1 Tax=Streptomyces justiciae TaxID=2780140 RepID=UPI002117FEDD|nr:GNAT family N-acetyltransferase [Streptomyces justiciae]MCW8375507.1 GNAT family N-acetyltransferase [Streptomyces justiciae]
MAQTRERTPSHHHTAPELLGHGLRLSPWDPDSDTEAATWLRARADPEFLRWNTPLVPVTDLDGARASLRAVAERVADGESASFRVADAASGTTLGHIGVNAIDPVMSVARVGYWVLPEARGHRVAARALSLTSRWAFTDLGLHRLELGHALGHEASCRVAERSGFSYEGTLRGAMFESGTLDAFRDVHLHARLATDPEPGEAATTPDPEPGEAATTPDPEPGEAAMTPDPEPGEAATTPDRR